MAQTNQKIEKEKDLIVKKRAQMEREAKESYNRNRDIGMGDDSRPTRNFGEQNNDFIF